ncbi:hypothetical protein AKJ16_DCAP16652 [Drosera capensis]
MPLLLGCVGALEWQCVLCINPKPWPCQRGDLDLRGSFSGVFPCGKKRKRRCLRCFPLSTIVEIFPLESVVAVRVLAGTEICRSCRFSFAASSLAAFLKRSTDFSTYKSHAQV